MSGKQLSRFLASYSIMQKVCLVFVPAWAYDAITHAVARAHACAGAHGCAEEQAKGEGRDCKTDVAAGDQGPGVNTYICVPAVCAVDCAVVSNKRTAPPQKQ